DIETDRSRRRIETRAVGGQNVREYGARRLVAGSAGIERDRFLVQAVAQQQSIDKATGVPSIENFISGAQHSLVGTVERVGKSDARRNFLVITRDAPSRRIIRIGERRLRQ